MRLARGLVDRASTAGVPAWKLAMRFAASVVRSRFAALHAPCVRIDHRGTHMVADLSTALGVALYRYGLLAPEARLIEELLVPGDVFVDGGAHVGMFTLIGAAAVGSRGTVIACEPVPGTMALLRANLALNEFAWVETHAVALSHRPGRAELFSFGSGSALSSFAPESHAGREALLVDVTCLDVIAADRCDRIRLVKLDLEGAEVLALRGAQAVLRQGPDFIIEVERDHLERQGTTIEEMAATFASAGYRPYQIHGDRRSVVLVPLASWERQSPNPNIFLSTRRVSEFPAAVQIADIDA